MTPLLKSLFDYKAWADEELLATLEAFDAARHPDAYRAMLQILDHANVVDRIFRGHLAGEAPRFVATNSDPLPGFAALRDLVRATDAWYVHFASEADPERLKRRLPFAFTDGARGAMSGEEMLLHVATHAGYHRGSIGQILEDLGLDSPPDSLTKFLHRSEPERRAGQS